MYVEEVYETVLRVYYPIYICVAMTQQLFFLFVIAKYTPSNLRSLRQFIVRLAIIEMFVVVTLFLTRSRLVVNKKSLGVVCYIRVSNYPEEFCQWSTNLNQCIATLTSITIAHTFYYKYKVSDELGQWNSPRTTLITLISTFFSTLYMVFSISVKLDPEKVAADIRAEHPAYSIPAYAVITGVPDSTVLPKVLNQHYLAVCTYGVPIVAYYYRRKINKALSAHSNALSGRTRQLVKVFIRGLTVQVAIPFVCSLMCFSFFLYTKFTGINLVLTEFAMSLLMSPMTLCTPPLSIYYTIPYRKAVVSLFSRTRPIAKNSTLVVNSITL